MRAFHRFYSNKTQLGCELARTSKAGSRVCHGLRASSSSFVPACQSPGRGGGGGSAREAAWGGFAVAFLPSVLPQFVSVRRGTIKSSCTSLRLCLSLRGRGGWGWCRCFRNPRGSPLHGWVRWGTGAGRRRVTRKREIHSSKRSEMQLQSPPRLVSLPACLLGAPTTAVKSTRRAGPWTQLLASLPPPPPPPKGLAGPRRSSPGFGTGRLGQLQGPGRAGPPTARARAQAGAGPADPHGGAWGGGQSQRFRGAAAPPVWATRALQTREKKRRYCLRGMKKQRRGSLRGARVAA